MKYWWEMGVVLIERASHTPFEAVGHNKRCVLHTISWCDIKSGVQFTLNDGVVYAI